MGLFRSLNRGYQNSQPETSRANQEDDFIESQAIARLSVLGEIELEQKRFMHCNGDCLLLTTTELGLALLKNLLLTNERLALFNQLLVLSSQQVGLFISHASELLG